MIYLSQPLTWLMKAMNQTKIDPGAEGMPPQQKLRDKIGLHCYASSHSLNWYYLPSANIVANEATCEQNSELKA